MSEDFSDVAVRPQLDTPIADRSVAEYVIATPAPRLVVIHYHILKNAGTTIEFILQREFGQDFARLHGSNPAAVLTASQAAEFLARHQQVRALSSHHLAYPTPQLPGAVVVDICFLRDPLERLWSFYKHLRRLPPDDDLTCIASRASLSSFLQLLIRDYPHLANDVQVNRLAHGGAYTRSPNQGDLEQAIGIVRRMSVLGIVELFDESCVAAEYTLHPAFPKFRMHYIRQNVSPLDPGDGRGFRAAAGEPAYRHLEQMNRLDRQLLQFAQDEVRRRFELVPEHQERLHEFRERCTAAEFGEITSSSRI